jgi:hypothetical protein
MGTNESTSDLQYALHDLVFAGEGGQVAYNDVTYQNQTTPHNEPNPRNPVDQPYFEFL